MFNSFELSILPIQFFADGEGGSEGTEATGVTPGDAASESVEPQIIYGLEDDPDDGDQQDTVPAENIPKNVDEEFSELIAKDGKYKAAFDARVQEILRARLKDAEQKSADAESQKKKLEAFSPLLSELARRYGKDVGDIDGISKAFLSDRKIYEEEAERNGTTADEVIRSRERERSFEDIKRQRDMLIAERERGQREEQARRRYDAMLAESEEVKKDFPDFDLRTEVKNSEFLSMLKAGVSMKSAYKALHADEIMQGAMAYAHDKASEEAVKRIAAKGRRPEENGLASATVVHKTDVNTLTDSDMDKINEQVRSGKKIRF